MKSKVLYFLFLTGFLLLIQNNSARAQQGIKPVISKKINYSKTSDPQLETAIRRSSGYSQEEIRYFYNMVDLNGDGKSDALVFVAGDAFCGTGGCNFLIFKGTARGFQLVTEMTVSRPPVFVANQKTNDWSDLVMRVSGGGIEPFYSHLKFNGKSYPKNPTVQHPVKIRLTGTEYLSGIESYDAGFLLK